MEIETITVNRTITNEEYMNKYQGDSVFVAREYMIAFPGDYTNCKIVSISDEINQNEKGDWDYTINIKYKLVTE